MVFSKFFRGKKRTNRFEIGACYYIRRWGLGLGVERISTDSYYKSWSFSLEVGPVSFLLLWSSFPNNLV